MFYTVKPSDTLSKIADKFDVKLSLLLAFNPQITDPDRIKVGQSIKIPNLEDVPANAPITQGKDVADLLARARSAVKQGIRYKLGEGGMKPTAAMPDSNGKCDCSGFVCWVLGVSRKTTHPFYQKHGGWIFTDSMEADVKSSSGIFEGLNTPEPGCIVVFGAGNAIGHVGLVSEVANGKMKKVIHCSSGNDANFRDSIQETGPAVFNRADALWGRFAGVV
ncbi:LysM peptidoglycan-binding domain-containing protein [Paraflavitalea pollutisoli]|uniref:LysM peptidoglycan-binding domain-containing protein n=1 Tax=Paraflavitalea pollutisoli TaxID=3034143 RepID=UPI0023EB22FB|nr:LysM peptidoglycan-binding domain-containing protein [Paraflavitalea sp. H1-2-19X]